jgi:NAD(P)-dependent dehydrogenase (short-subunit alcohol dehydrogenase family)
MNTETNIFDLKKRVFIVTGGAGYLGMKHVEAILEANGRVALFDIDESVIQKASNLNSKNTKGYVVDITDEGQIESAIKQVIKDFGTIYGLVNNAANNPKMRESNQKTTGLRLESFPKEVWDKDIDVGITGAFLMSKYVGREMVKNNEGVILNIASDLSVIAPDQRIYRKDGEDKASEVKPVTYSVTKHALIGLTKYLATYWAEEGIRVNALSPGGVTNPNIDPEFKKKLVNLIPMARMAEPDEYKGAVIFLLSDASKYMTGNNIVMDGGRSIW